MVVKITVRAKIIVVMVVLEGARRAGLGLRVGKAG
jgi:hypothetical protein